MSSLIGVDILQKNENDDDEDDQDGGDLDQESDGLMLE